MDLWALTDLCTPWCVHVAVTLRAAEHIAAGKTAAAEIAEAAGADAESLRRVLHHLVSKGLFEEPSPGVFALNEAARGLLEPGVRLGFDLDAFGGRMAGAWNTLLSAVRTGRPAYHEAFGRPFWEDLDAHPPVAEAFDALMGPPGHGVPDPHVLADPGEWAAIRSVVDVGGGTGSLLAEILRAHPHLNGTLLDLPRTVARAAEVFRAAGVADRVTIAAQSFFDPLPAGHDLYVISKVIGDWPDAEATAILRRAGEAAGAAGRVVAVGEGAPERSGSADLLMMALIGGKERNLDEFRSIAEAARLTIATVGRQSSGRYFVECRAR